MLPPCRIVIITQKNQTVQMLELKSTPKYAPREQNLIKCNNKLKK